MIHGNQLHFVGVRRLPKLLSELQQIAPISRLERVTGDAQVLLGRTRRGERALTAAGHESQRHSERASPHRIGDEAELLSIPGVGERARAFEHLALDDILVRAGEVDGLWNSIGPFDAQHISLEMWSESKVCHAVCDYPRLIKTAGAQLESRSDAGRVVLSASVADPF